MTSYTFIGHIHNALLTFHLQRLHRENLPTVISQITFECAFVLG